MTIPTDEPFIFEFTHFIFVDRGMWTFTNEPELRLLGQLIRGKITKGDFITLPTAQGPVAGVIVQFMERLDGWDALPFYDRLRPDDNSFCLVVMGISSNSVPLCPGTAHFAKQESVVPDVMQVEYPDEHCGEFRF